MEELKSLQSLLYRLITAPSGVAEGLAAERELSARSLDAIVLGDERLSAADRVDIYANMYFYRLLDALKEDFPATLAVLGADNFHNLVTGYLLEYPPTEPSLYYCGRYLADYLRDHPLSENVPFIADLARLERSSVEVFHGADAPVLESDALQAVAPADWPAMKLADSSVGADTRARLASLGAAARRRRESSVAARGAGRGQSPRMALQCARLPPRARTRRSRCARGHLARRGVRRNLRRRRGQRRRSRRCRRHEPNARSMARRPTAHTLMFFGRPAAIRIVGCAMQSESWRQIRN